LCTARSEQNYATPYYFTTFAGASSVGVLDGQGRAARFNQPYGLARDGAGNLYVADSNNHAIRRILPDGTVGTLAGRPGEHGSADGAAAEARFFAPLGVAVDSNGDILVADTRNHTIRRITSGGVVTTVAGLAGVSGSADGQGAEARFNFPSALTVDGGGNIFVSESRNFTLRKIAPNGQVSTLAGTAGVQGSADGLGTAAQFSYPVGIGVDGAGNVYVADRGNRVIRRIASGGFVTTLAGSPGLGKTQKYSSPPGTLPDPDGLGPDARFDAPTGLTLDAAGIIYVSDDTSADFVRRVTPDGQVSTLAVSAYASPVAAPFGERLESVAGLVVADDGGFYLSDSGGNCVRHLDAAGVVTTFAGLPFVESAGRVDGPTGASRFSAVHGPVTYVSNYSLSSIAATAAGDLYVLDSPNAVIRKVAPDGLVSTVAGAERVFDFVDGQGAAARFNFLTAATADAAGNLYVADGPTIRKLTPSGEVTTLAGSPDEAGDADGTGASARFAFIHCLATAADGTLYAVDGSPDLVSFTPINVRKITPQGTVTTVGDLATSDTRGIAVDGAGNLYLDSLNAIVKISPTGERTVLAGNAEDFIDSEADLAKDGAGAAARFRYPYGIALDAGGNLYVADTGNGLIRRVSPSGEVTTLGGVPSAGDSGSFNSVDGTGSAARFLVPRGIALGPQGVLYVADGTTIRKGQPAGAPVISVQPRSQSVALSASVQFTVEAQAVPTPLYQWYHDGAPIAGANSNILSIAGVRESDLGSYTVAVSNAVATVTSSTATLTTPTATAGAAAASASTDGGGAFPAWFAAATMLLLACRSQATRLRRTPGRGRPGSRPGAAGM
jgi:sugar lactone lactonase YvrE